MESYYGHPEERNVIRLVIPGPSPKQYGPYVEEEILKSYVDSAKYDEREKDTMFEGEM